MSKSKSKPVNPHIARAVLRNDLRRVLEGVRQLRDHFRASKDLMRSNAYETLSDVISDLDFAVTGIPEESNLFDRVLWQEDLLEELRETLEETGL